jgi:hypothetical protein
VVLVVFVVVVVVIIVVLDVNVVVVVTTVVVVVDLRKRLPRACNSSQLVNFRTRRSDVLHQFANPC